MIDEFETMIFDDFVHDGLEGGNESEFGSLESEFEVHKSDLENYDESSEDQSNSGYESEGVEFALINQSRKPVKYDVDDSNPHFLLGMTFANAIEARKAIAKYSISKCTPLKLNPNEKGRIRAKCKNKGCPFV